MRLLYLTAHLSDVDLAQRALEKSASGSIRIEACATARDIGPLLAAGAADAVVVDLTVPHADVPRLLGEVRAAAPATVLVALVRAGAGTAVADALVAGADEAIAKQKEFYLQLPAVVSQAQARRRAQGERRARLLRVLAVGTSQPVLPEGSRLQFLAADEIWWQSPAEKTASAGADAVVLDDGRGVTATVAAVAALREGGVLAPVVVLASDPDAGAREAYGRAGVEECLARAEGARLPDTVERAVETARLTAELTLLRAREQRLRALIESIPVSVTLVGADGTVQAMNLAGLALVGARASAEVVGRPIDALCNPEVVDDLKAFIRRVCAGTPGQARFAGRGLDGQPRTFEFRAVPLRRGRDTASALGVMRLAPVETAAPRPQVPTESGSEVEIPLDADAGPPKAEPGGGAEFEALRLELEYERAAHLDSVARLEALDAQRAVSEAAWNAVQSELERKLLLQFRQPSMEQQHEATRALLEQALRDKDAELSRLADDRAAALDRARQAESENARLRESLENAARLQAELDAAVRVREQVEDQLAAMRQEAADAASDRDAARTALAQASTELAQLRALTDAQSREHATLVDVRQQVARLQAAATTVEQQRRALDEAHDQLERLRQALEDALGAHTDVERQLHEKEAEAAGIARQLDLARAAQADVEAELASTREQLAAIAQHNAVLAGEATAAARALEERARTQAEVVRLTAELDAVRQEATRRAEALDASRAELETWRARLADAEADAQALRRDLDAWRGRGDALREELDRAVAELEDARRRLADADLAAAEYAEARRALEAAQTELALLRPALDLARTDKANLAAEAQNYRDTTEHLRGLLRHSDEHALAVSALRTDLTAAAEARAALEAEIDALRANLAAAIDARDALQRDVDAARTEAGAAAPARTALEADIATLRADLDASTGARDHLQQRVDALQAELQAAAEARDAHRANLDSLRATLADTVTARDHLQQRVDALQAELQAAAEAREAHRADLDSLRGDLAAAIDARDALQRDVDAARAEASTAAAARAALEADIATLRADLDASTGARDHLQQRVDALQAELQAAAEARDAHRADLDSLRATLADAVTARDHLQQRVDALQAELQAAAEARDAHRVDLDSLRGDLAAAIDARDALQRDVDAARAALEADIATLRADLDASTGARDHLQQRVDALQAELQAAAEARDAHRVDLDSLRGDLAAAIDARDALQRDVDAARAALEADIATLRADLDASTATRDHLQARIETLQVELHAAADHEHELASELAKIQQDRNTAVLQLAKERALREQVQELRATAEANAAGLLSRLTSTEDDLGSARATLKDALLERNALKQALTDAAEAVSRHELAAAELKAQVEALLAESAAARASADAAIGETASLRTALDAARAERAQWLDRIDEAERVGRTYSSDLQSLRDRIAQLETQLAEQRLLASEFEGQRESLREALARADAATQLLTTRHLEERASLDRAMSELRDALSQAEQRWSDERAELDRALQARATALRRITESGIVGVATSTTRGRIVRCNDALARLCGYRSADDLTSAPADTALPFVVDWDALTAQLNASPSPVLVDTCVQHPDGGVAWLEASASLSPGGPQGPVIEWTAIDTTDRHLRLRQLRQAQRLDAVRELAASAGVEIVDRLSARPVDVPADELQRAATRARELAQQLVAFAQKQVRLPQFVDLNATVSHLAVTLRRLAGDETTLETRTGAGPLVASVDPGEAEQWIASLVVAARDALPVGGTLTITTQPVDLVTSPAPGERRVAPVARLAFAASGFGARAVAAPATVADALSQRGGTLRLTHEPESGVARVELYLPLVLGARPMGLPFPLLRTDRTTAPERG
jgi:PAS domain S-box-containing protein